MLNGGNDGGGDSLATRLSRTHPFWTLNSGWVDAVELQPGDACMDETERPVQVLSTEVTETTCTTYNLTVAAQHSYFVNKNGVSVLVHNTNMTTAWQWIVYAMQIPGPENTTKWYIGRASMESRSDLRLGISDASASVFHYRAGADGKQHHVWKKFGKEFVPPGDASPVKFKILDSHWALPSENQAAKERCMAIERHCVEEFTSDRESLLNKNIPLSRHPNEHRILNEWPSTNLDIRKAVLKLNCP